MEESDLQGATALGASERVAVAEEQFVSGMVKDLAARRGEKVEMGTKRSVEERIAAMPEPWKSRTRNELERIREDVAEMLAESGEGEAATGNS